jgi:hypothetical protein
MAPAGSSKCPYCDEEIGVELELPFGSAECSKCAGRVWFLTVNGERTFFRYEAAALVRRLFDGLAAEQRLPENLDALEQFVFVADFEDELNAAM